MNQVGVLIVGAGPTGLVLALWLTNLGVKVRIIDKTAQPGTTSRALAVHARTLELYRQMDLAETVVEQSRQVSAARLWVDGAPVASVSIKDISAGLTPYPFLLNIFPQDEHERLLLERLEALGVAVERQTELHSFEDLKDRIIARLLGPDGQGAECEAKYIAGCDGARSAVRETMETGFPGGTYRQLFYVADVDAAGPPMDGELHVDLDQADFLALMPLAGAGRARLIGTVRDERADRADQLRFEDVSHRVIHNLKVDVRKVNWFSTYHVHHRVTNHFRNCRAFLLGDAAHIHSPAGGQGMNTGIGDAINLAWKLAAVLGGRAPDGLLDSYEAERISFARRLVATTDRGFSFATADGPLAALVRKRIAPVLLPKIVAFASVREFIFRTVSQITLNYRNGPLSRGAVGRVCGGDRLPWAPVDGIDNFASLKAMTWQVHIYGQASAELQTWCAERDMPLCIFRWRAEYDAAGLTRDAVYLLRPDTYVALVTELASPSALEGYFDEHSIRP
jgi:2-polyprenyl-6-methoxyphenol hydroxylase-like FAD-dependent oxidoreductase